MAQDTCNLKGMALKFYKTCTSTDQRILVKMFYTEIYVEDFLTNE